MSVTDYPAYTHDCLACHFLGQDSWQPGEPQCNIVDLYICNQARTRSLYALIRRYSSDPPNYGAQLLDNHSARYDIVVKLAKEQGYI